LALFSYYATSRINIRPVQADAILPANNPKLADQKLGAAVFQEIQILRFLGNTAAVGRHEGVLKFITDRGNATRAEVEAFYRANVRDLIAGVVDEEFNKISFLLDKTRQVSYNAVLARNPQTGQYVLSYGGVETNGETRTVTGNSVDALSSEMRNGNNKTDFAQLSIDQVRAQAALIPAVKLNAQAMDDIKTILTNFYINPNAGTYNAVKDAYILFHDMSIRDGGQAAFVAINDSYGNVLYGLNHDLGGKVIRDSRGQNVAASLTRDQQARLVELRK
jgi:hypothetical protein